MSAPGLDTLWCVACVQEHYMTVGITREQVQSGTYQCDFYNQDELTRRGFVEVGEYGSSQVEQLCAKLLSLIREARICLLDQGATGIGSGPDYVTLWARGGVALT